MVESAGKRDLELTWLACFVDTEGCLGLHKKHMYRGKYSIGPEITLCNTDGRLLQRVRYIMKQHELPHYVHVYQGKHNKKANWVVKIYGMKRAKRFLEAILPYLVGKADQALAMLEFISYRLAVGPQVAVGAQEEAWWKKLRDLKEVPNLRDYTIDSPNNGDEDIVQS